MSIVSPGFTPRPSLSEPGGRGFGRDTGRVAGVHAPAFVERRRSPAARQAGIRVSPGFTPRPSLSGGRSRGRCRGDWRVSPGFTPRPSLSADIKLEISILTSQYAEI